jgi:hypothetical protein
MVDHPFPVEPVGAQEPSHILESPPSGQLAHLKGLTDLQILDLGTAPVAGAGLAHFRGSWVSSVW